MERKNFKENKILNCTPHPINIIVENSKIEIEPSGFTIRIGTIEKDYSKIEIDGLEVPIKKIEYSGIKIFRGKEEISIEQFREIAEGKILIVPTLLKDIAPELKEKLRATLILSPNTNSAIRDSDGRIIGISSFVLLS